MPTENEMIRIMKLYGRVDIYTQDGEKMCRVRAVPFTEGSYDVTWSGAQYGGFQSNAVSTMYDDLYHTMRFQVHAMDGYLNTAEMFINGK